LRVDGDQHGLASLDSLGDPERLRDDLRRRLRGIRRAADDAPVLDGTDGAESVRVVVDPRARVADVELGPRWDRRDLADRFAPALFEAYTAAVGAAMTAAAAAAMESSDGSGDESDGGRPDARGPAPDGGRAVDERLWLDRTWAAIGAVETELDRLRRRDTTAATAERSVTSPAGLLTVRVRGGAITAITGNAARIAVAGRERLASDALAALRLPERP
jgi:hypothetical protein